MFLKQKNVSLNSIQHAQFDEFKISRKKFKNFRKTGKTAEMFFLRMRFHLMRQSKLKVRANTIGCVSSSYWLITTLSA